MCSDMSACWTANPGRVHVTAISGGRSLQNGPITARMPDCVTASPVKWAANPKHAGMTGADHRVGADDIATAPCTAKDQ